MALGAETLSRAQLAAKTGLSDKVVRNWLAVLRKEGAIETVGNPRSRNVRYRILNQVPLFPDEPIVGAVDASGAAVGDAAGFLDVHVHQLAGPVVFVAADHLAGGPAQEGQPVQTVPLQDPVDGRGGQSQDRVEAGRSELAAGAQTTVGGLAGDAHPRGHMGHRTARGDTLDEQTPPVDRQPGVTVGLEDPRCGGSGQLHRIGGLQLASPIAWSALPPGGRTLLPGLRATPSFGVRFQAPCGLRRMGVGPPWPPTRRTPERGAGSPRPSPPPARRAPGPPGGRSRSPRRPTAIAAARRNGDPGGSRATLCSLVHQGRDVAFEVVGVGAGYVAGGKWMASSVAASLYEPIKGGRFGGVPVVRTPV